MVAGYGVRDPMLLISTVTELVKASFLLLFVLPTPNSLSIILVLYQSLSGLNENKSAPTTSQWGFCVSKWKSCQRTIEQGLGLKKTSYALRTTVCSHPLPLLLNKRTISFKEGTVSLCFDFNASNSAR